VSLHLTIGVLAHTVADVVHDLVRRAIDADPACGARSPSARRRTRRSSPTSCGDGRRARRQGRCRRRRRGGRRPRPPPHPGPAPSLEGQLQQLAGLAAISDDTCVRRRPGSTWRCEQPEDELRLVLADRTVTLPVALRAALDRLAPGEPVAVRDLADLLDGPSRLVLVRRLVREGALVAIDAQDHRAG
jgi:hypothetical protein